MKQQKFAIYTKNRFFLEKIHHVYDTITEAAKVCESLNEINPSGSPVYRIKPIITYMEV